MARCHPPARFDGYEWGVSAVTLGELRLGVLRASSPDVSARRLATYQLAQRFQPLEVDETVTEHWALLVARLRATGRKVPINDCWIAATALAHDIPIVTQDGEYEAMPGLTVRKL
ncbi:PIN domain-containing protein [Nocardia sp. R7R-8]|uniref:PIN domain-containing protein n=1 Tax=Nocardia sp. R7R-8 TaxID=3459304 RepID=UPI00403E16CA